MRRARSGNLTALLVVVSALEFIVNRLAGRLFFPRPALSSGGSGSNAIHAISWVGSWLFQLTALLALAVMVTAFIGLFRRGELYPRWMRFATMVVAVGFSFLVGWAVFTGGINTQWFVWAQGAFAFLALLTAIAFVSQRGAVSVESRHRHAGAAGRTARLRLRGVAAPDRGHRPFRRGEAGARPGRSAPARGGGDRGVAGGLLAPLLLPPRPVHERRWHVPLAIATALTGLFVFALCGGST